MGLLFRSLIRLLQIYKVYYRNLRTVDLSYAMYGEESGIPVIVIHSLMGSKKIWHDVCERLNQSTRKWIIALDVRNHGNSPHTRSHTYPEMAADVLRLMDDLKVKQASLLGHRMGGRAAMVTALIEPDRVKDLVVVDISPVYMAGINIAYYLHKFEVMRSIQFTTKDITKAKEEARQQLHAKIKSKEMIELIMTNLEKRDDKIGWICNLNTLREHGHDIASFPYEMKNKIYPGPALFIAGWKSRYLPPDDLPNIRTFFPNAELKVLKMEIHNLHFRKYDEFIHLITKYFSV